MRPARKGPENQQEPEAGAPVVGQASMRPARKGPENHTGHRRSSYATVRFNEAGPQGAGKPGGHQIRSPSADRCFNEAGPQGAGKPRPYRSPRLVTSRCFNEAGPQGAGKPSEQPGNRALFSGASMRPARKGPENRRRARWRARPGARFNEAGPQGAGKPDPAHNTTETLSGGFNEAGPQGAGKPRQRDRRVPAPVRASMRPARKGPENLSRTAWHIRGNACFNEAGPQGAGKPAPRGCGCRSPARCFNEAGPQGAGKPCAFCRRRVRCSRFNEAGPQGAGKPTAIWAIGTSVPGSFNEAGPQGAGKPPRGLNRGRARRRRASMRPARKGPENPYRDLLRPWRPGLLQ